MELGVVAFTGELYPTRVGVSPLLTPLLTAREIGTFDSDAVVLP